MNYKIIFTRSAEKDLAEIPKSHYSNIIAHISQLSGNPRPSGVKKLKGYENNYRIRVAQYRILFEIHDKTITILIIAISHRKDAYK